LNIVDVVCELLRNEIKAYSHGELHPNPSTN